MPATTAQQTDRLAATFDDDGITLLKCSAVAGTDSTDGIRVPLPNYSTSRAAEWIERSAALLQAVVGSKGWSGMRVVSVLPAQVTQYQRLLMAPMPAEDLAAAVEWQVSQELHVAPREVAVGYHMLGELTEFGKTRLEVIAVSCLTHDIDSYLAVLRGAGLTPVAIDSWPSTVARGIKRLAGDPVGAMPHLVLSVEPSACTCFVACDAGLHCVRRVIRPVSSATSVAADSASLMTHGITVATQSVEFLMDGPSERRPQRGLLLHPEPMASASLAMLSLATNIEFYTLDEIARNCGLPETFLTTMRESPGSWLSAYGLLARDEKNDTGCDAINLMPTIDVAPASDRTNNQSRLRQRRVLVAVVLAWAAVLGTHHAILSSKLRAAADELAALELIASEADLRNRECERLEAQLAMTNTLRAPISAGAILALLSQAVPDEMSFDALTLDVPYHQQGSTKPEVAGIRISGHLTSDEALPDLMSKLHDARVLKSIVVERSGSGRGSAASSFPIRLSMEMPLRESPDEP